jgi:HPt (histidine-containing phosphotransfer) domain-containing protein
VHLQELPQYVAIDIQEALEERFMESEAMYVRFLRKLLTSDDYQLMEEAAEAGNLQEVLRYAHNLKGVCATLGLTGLQAQFADIVSLLRSGDYTLPQLQAKLAAVKNDWQRTLQYIEQLESA